MICSSLNEQWYVIYTKPNFEKKLLANLQEKHIECYLPMRKVLKLWSDRKKWVEEPLFRGYVFVKVNHRHFFSALNTPGAVCFVCFGGKAESIPESEINNIKLLTSQCDREITISYERNIHKGEHVEVIHGSFSGVKGEVINILGQNRLLVRIDSIRCSLYANISKEEVKILNDMPSVKNDVSVKIKSQIGCLC